MTHARKMTEEEMSVPSLYSYPGAVMQLLTVIIIAGLFLLTSIPHMDSFKAMDPSDNLDPENKAFLYVFNIVCYINIATALIGVVKSKGERVQIAVVGLVAGVFCYVLNFVVPYLF
jgi:hypothetical protein